LADAVPQIVNTLPSREAVTVPQKQMPFSERDRISVIPMQNLEQNYVPPDSTSPENKGLEVGDTRKYIFSPF
jgi:interleukin-1 receptor-associated kinase 4